MIKFLELNLADGKPLDIPPATITMFEAMHRGKNEHFPDARSFVRYSLGTNARVAVLSNSFEDLVRMLDINVRPGAWLVLTREDGDRVAVLESNVVAREAIEGGAGACKLTISFGAAHELGELIVRETRDEVKAQMERPAPLPAPEVDMPVPVAAERRDAKPNT